MTNKQAEASSDTFEKYRIIVSSILIALVLWEFLTSAVALISTPIFSLFPLENITFSLNGEPILIGDMMRRFIVSLCYLACIWGMNAVVCRMTKPPSFHTKLD